MKISQHGRVALFDFEPTAADVSNEVLNGLLQAPKSLPCKLLYDERGSQIFEEICTLDEYYPTRTEVGILTEHGPQMAALIGSSCYLFELGSGSSTKTRTLLDCLEEPAAYVPVDIARVQLLEAAEAIAAHYSELPVLAVCADYTEPFDLPDPPTPAARIVTFFPGSTIGNLEPGEAERFLQRVAEWCGDGGGLLIGVDLKKDRAILEPAYNDKLGVTAAFNLNLLLRINRELGADLRVDDFHHQAIYDETRGCIEMRLISDRRQTAHVLGHEISFDEGEPIVTEHSYKYGLDEFQRLAARAGFKPARAWTDERRLFSVHYLTVGA